MVYQNKRKTMNLTLQIVSLFFGLLSDSLIFLLGFLIVITLLCAHHETEALGNIAVLDALLNHEAALGAKRHNGGKEGQALDLRVGVVFPQLVQRDEGASSSHTGTAVH